MQTIQIENVNVTQHMFPIGVISGWYLATKAPILIEDELFINASPTLDTRCHKYGVHSRSGTALFSGLLPDDFYFHKNDVIIAEGILIEGVLRYRDLKQIHKQLESDYGPWHAIDFITRVRDIGESLVKLLSYDWPEIKEPEGNN
jgi:hypothetical protein